MSRKDKLRLHIRKLKEESKYSTDEWFSKVLGISLTKYRKYIDGETAVPRSIIEQIINLLKLPEKDNKELRRLWLLAYLESNHADFEDLIKEHVNTKFVAERIINEVEYPLKKIGIKIPRHVKKSILKGVLSIINNLFKELL